MQHSVRLLRNDFNQDNPKFKARVEEFFQSAQAIEQNGVIEVIAGDLKAIANRSASTDRWGWEIKRADGQLYLPKAEIDATQAINLTRHRNIEEMKLFLARLSAHESMTHQDCIEAFTDYLLQNPNNVVFGTLSFS